jgi:acetoin utilization deacetylase AcuC-like enzyme
MRIVRSDGHRAHFPSGELSGGVLVPPFECPERVEYIEAALVDRGLTDVTAPEPVEDRLLAAVHDAGYLEFLRTGWDAWVADGHAGDMIPTCFPARRMAQRVPADIDGMLGYYAFAAETSITAGTWSAAHEAASIARTAQRLVSGGESVAFGLCRPPGHHASRDFFGGYCFLNNAAVAAQGFRDDGAERVAVLDVDFHHGNGTQDIFWDRGDVFFASIHGDPRSEFPHFLGFADETGAGAGDGATVNHPLAPGTGFDEWVAALDDCLARIGAHGVDALVVSLGVDTYMADPISSFRLESNDFTTMGRHIGADGLPTVYCMEGGYAVEEIGTNTVNVLEGHLDG